MAEYININGQVIPATEGSLSYDNRAFRYGHGLFETMLVMDGVIQLGDYHWERLFTGLSLLHFNVPAHFTAAYLLQQVMDTVNKNELSHLCRVRLQCYEQEGNISDAANEQPGFIIECFPLDKAVLEVNAIGLLTGIAVDVHKTTDSLANLKTSNALVYAMAAKQAQQNKWDDALVCNTAGNIIESAISNIFWIKHEMVHTPPLKEGCVAGVMRRHVLHVLANKGYTIREIPMEISELRHADSVFLTNAIRRIKWVRAVNEHAYAPHDVADIYNAVFK